MDSEEVRPDLDSAWPIAPIQTIRLTKTTKIKILIFETRVVPFLVVVLESSTTDNIWTTQEWRLRVTILRDGQFWRRI